MHKIDERRQKANQNEFRGRGEHRFVRFATILSNTRISKKPTELNFWLHLLLYRSFMCRRNSNNRNTSFGDAVPVADSLSSLNS